MHHAGTMLIATWLVAASVAEASDASNLCLRGDAAASAHIQLPTDDASHYPGQWTRDPAKTSMYDPNNGFEYTMKTYHWEAYPLSGGKPIELHALAAGIAGYLPSPFAGGERGWVRVFLGSLVVPGGENYHYVYFAPGEFAPRQGGYDYSVGGLGEFVVLESADSGIVPVANPLATLGRLTGTGGTGIKTDVATADGLLEIHTTEESLKNPHPLFKDGYDPTFRYFYQRSALASWGRVKFKGEEYYVLGSANEMRQWQLSLEELPKFQWLWSGFNIEGCLDVQGRKIACKDWLRSFSLWDAKALGTQANAIHTLNEMGAPPRCVTHTLPGAADWSISVTDQWVSPRSGIKYARQVHITAPSLGADLYLTAVNDDQEIYKAVFLFPGFWEGAVRVSGKLGNRRVFGSGYLEQWNQTP